MIWLPPRLYNITRYLYSVVIIKIHRWLLSLLACCFHNVCFHSKQLSTIFTFQTFHSFLSVFTNWPLSEYVNQLDLYFSISRYVVTQEYYKLYMVRKKTLCSMEHNIVRHFQLIKFHFGIWNVCSGSHLLKIRRFDLNSLNLQNQSKIYKISQNLKIYKISQKAWFQFCCKWDRVKNVEVYFYTFPSVAFLYLLLVDNFRKLWLIVFLLV